MRGPSETTWDRGSRLVAAAVVLLSLAQLAHAAYRLSLPSDGWLYPFDVGGGRQRFVLQAKVAGPPSQLRPGDALLAIDGRSVEDLMAAAFFLRPARPPGWEAGGRVGYTVLRDGRELTVEAPLVRRHPPSAAWDLLRWTLGQYPFVFVQLPLAAFVFLRRPGSPAAQVLLLHSTAAATASAVGQGLSGPGLGPTVLFDAWAFWPAWLLAIFLWPLIAVPAIPHLFLLFPVPKGPMRTRPLATTAAVYGFMALMVLLALPRSLGVPITLLRHVLEIGPPALTLSVAIIGASILHTLRTQRDPYVRAQIGWLGLGALLFVSLQLPLFFLANLGIIEQTPLVGALSTVAYLTLPVSLAVAILRFRLFEIEVIVRRTLLYATLTGALALVYLAAVTLLQAAFRTLAGQQSDLAIVLSTLAIACLFQPLRRRIQAFIDRRFYRRRYDAQRTLQAFAEHLRRETDVSQIEGRLLGAVRQTIQPAHARLWLRKMGR